MTLNQMENSPLMAEVHVRTFQLYINKHAAVMLLAGLSFPSRHVHQTSGYFHQCIDEVFRSKSETNMS